MILNWENKPNLKNQKDFFKKNLINKLNSFFNTNKNNLLINSENNDTQIFCSLCFDKPCSDPSNRKSNYINVN